MANGQGGFWALPLLQLHWFSFCLLDTFALVASLGWGDPPQDHCNISSLHSR